MRDILTVTLNPALDIATEVGKVIPGVKLRCDPAQTDPGGGGINVSRAVAILGGTSRCFVALGGLNGQRLAGLLADAGLDVIGHSTAGETRSSLAVMDRESGEQFRFMLPGPVWSTADAAAAADAVVGAVRPGGLVVLSGSLPPGVDPAILGDLSTRIAASGAQVIIDTSGPGLRQLVTRPVTPPHVLRMNQAEADDLAGHALRDLTESADFAASLVDRGIADIVIVARGAEGSVLATAGRRLHARAADVPIRSKVGAGDSFVGGFTLALAREMDLAEALSRGAAAASAAVMTDGTLLCRFEDAERLIAVCPASEI